MFFMQWAMPVTAWPIAARRSVRMASSVSCTFWMATAIWLATASASRRSCSSNPRSCFLFTASRAPMQLSSMRSGTQRMERVLKPLFLSARAENRVSFWVSLTTTGWRVWTQLPAMPSPVAIRKLFSLADSFPDME